ncbi:hypothetical protein ACSBPQ_14490 [Stenotrophomonas sp. JC08]|uniref:hypothetical protein n=1 Tax=Stenotrophomonas sp. JC08 TaxID=3445779 RepID=UPI003FA211B0
MTEDDFDDDWDFSPFGSAAEARKRALLVTAGKPAHSLSPIEIFELVKNSVHLEKFVPLALDLIEAGRDFDLGPVEDEWRILERQHEYFRQHHNQRVRFERLSRNRYSLRAGDVGVYRKCGRCTDGVGELKNLYSTKEAALSAAAKRSAATSLRLEAYKCPHQDGWHLTKADRV